MDPLEQAPTDENNNIIEGKRARLVFSTRGAGEGISMEHKSCPVFVDGKECDRPLTLVDLEGKKIARYDLATYECNLRHRTYFLLEPK